MSSPEDKEKHRKRMKRKQREKKIKVKSPIAKSLEDAKFRQRIVKDKRGKEHDLTEMTHADLIHLIQED